MVRIPKHHEQLILIACACLVLSLGDTDLLQADREGTKVPRALDWKRKLFCVSGLFLISGLSPSNRCLYCVI